MVYEPLKRMKVLFGGYFFMVKKIFEKLKNKKSQASILDAMLFDFQSHRHYDDNGRLIVDQTLITKACVNEYYGKEIPNFLELGLEPYTKYKVLRPAEELEKALPKFNNIPVLNKHIMDYADLPQKDSRCGGLSNCTFKEGAVYGDLNIWDKVDIDRVESGELKDLSAGYNCQFVKEGGEYNGEHYDLKMVNIMPNHLALVKKGRVDGAYVFDEHKGEEQMVKKLAELLQKLGIKDEDIKELAKEEVKATEPKNEPAKDEEPAKEDKRKLIDEIGGILKGKVDEEILRTILGKAEKLAYKGSETSEADDEEPKKEEPAKDKVIEKKEKKDEEEIKKIKDEAKEEAKKELQSLNAAKEEVEDVCGKIGTQDSREAYYKIGCEALGLSTKGVCDSAFEPMFKGAIAVKKQNAKKAVVLDEEASAKIRKDVDGVLAGLPKRKF